MEQRLDDLEKRVEKLEQIKGQTEPIKISRIEIDAGDMRERLDELERKQAEAINLLRGIREAQADHGEKFDTLAHVQQESKEELRQEIYTISSTWLESLQENIYDIKMVQDAIKTTQADHSERFDRLDYQIKDVHAKLDTQHQQSQSRFDKLEAMLSQLFDL